MYCPNCGKSNTTEQKFCRSCGLELSETTASLLRQLPGSERADLIRREQLINHFGGYALAVFGCLAGLGVVALVYFILDEFLFSGRNPLLGIFFAIFIISAVSVLVFVVMREFASRNTDLKKPIDETGAPVDYLPPVVTARLDEGTTEPASVSVTEDSTELLPADVRRRS